MYRILLALFFWLLCVVFVRAQTYVSPDGSGGGTSWADPSSLADAIGNASNGDDLWLLEGVYEITETLELSYGQSNISLYGGFNGTETALDQRDYENNQTILDGGGTTQIMKIDADRVEIDGLVFLEGFAATGADENEGSGGGAIYVSGNDVTITNSIFRNNVSAHRIGSGAIYLWLCDNIRIMNCLFEGNRVTENTSEVGNIGGGAIHIRFGSNTEIINTTFRNNYSRYAGGAVQDWGEETHFGNCVFEDNESEEAGGGLYIRADPTHVDNCRFEGNQAVDGGGVYLSNDNSRFTNSIFRNNEASNNGGGVAISSGGIEITASRFEQNRSLGNGGAIYNHRFTAPSIITRAEFSENTANQGGAIYNFSEEGLKIVNSLFVANQAMDKGGAIFNNRFIEIANATFVQNANTALIISSSAQSAYNHCETNIFNSIFYLNTAKSGGYRADIHSEDLNRDLSTQDVRRNILQEYTGTSNQVGVDPLFVNNTEDFRPQTASPAIDAGRVTLFNGVSDVNAGTTIDLEGNQRNQGANIDMGAYEIDPSTIAIPTCAMITAPSDGASDVVLDAEIIWDAVINATAYRIYIGTSAGGTDVVDGEEVIGTTYTPGVDWEEGTTYYVTVVPFNAAGEAEDCAVVSFTTVELLEAPECTVITSPMDGTTDIALDAEIVWDAVDDADGYRIYIGKTSDGTDVVNGEEITGTTYTPASGWEEGTTYYVRVISFNATGEADGCAEVSFSTTETILTVPGCATITGPSAGATDVSLNADITWGAVTGADGYYVSIGTTSGGTELVDRADVSGTTYNPATDFPEGTEIYVSVIPYNAAGEATGCVEISFTTETLPTVPDCTAIINLSDGDTDVSVSTNITWDAVPGADGYYVTIGTTSGGTDIANSEDVAGTSFNPPADFPENETIYVSLVPYNAAGEATGCAEISFATEVLLDTPGCTTIIFPIDGALDVAIDAEITWDAVDDADGYRIYIGTSAGGTDVLDGEEVMTGTSFIPTGGWEEGEAYFVRVVPFNASGEAADCTEISFTTVARPEPPQADDQQFCPPATAADLVAAGTDIRWYDQAAGGTALSTTAALSTGTYYVTQTVEGIESDRRTVAVTVETPLAPQFNVDITGCGNVTVADLGDMETGLRWYNQATGGTALSPTTALTTGTYYASRISGTCESDRTAVQVIISVTPVPDVPDQRFVIGSTFADLNVMGQNLRWYTEPSGSTSFDPQTVISNGIYYVSQTIDGCESDRVIVQINITSVPHCVANISPANNATDIAVNASITWDAVDDADGYHVYIGTTSGGMDVVAGEEVTGTTYMHTSDLGEGNTYYVTVVPFNGAGEAEGCTEISFTTETEEIPIPEIPECTTITSPINGEEATSLQAGITWLAVAGADGYRITIGTTPDNGDLADGVEVNGTVFHPTFEFAENTTYYITVIPFNTAGDATGCGQLRFTIIPDDSIDRTKYGFSPNGDGINDYWSIDGIEQYPDNTVTLYNRWGDMVFQIEGYNNQSNIFRGEANKLTRLGAGMLPSGTYFFAIQYRDGRETKRVEGFVVLRR